MNWKCIGVLAVTAEGAALCNRELVRLSTQFTNDGSHPEIVLHQYSFHQYHHALEQLANGDSTFIVKTLLSPALKLKNAGAEFLIIPANTPHLVFDEFSRQAPVPTISIVKATQDLCVEKGFKRPLVLGTQWTMEKKLYGNNCQSENGLEMIYPAPDEQEKIHRIIFEDLIAGRIPEDSRAALYQIVERNKVCHAVDSVILGCTELPLIFDERSPLPAVDSGIGLVLRALQVAAA